MVSLTGARSWFRCLQFSPSVFLFQDPLQDHVVFSHHVFLGSFQLQQFLSFSVFHDLDSFEECWGGRCIIGCQFTLRVHTIMVICDRDHLAKIVFVRVPYRNAVLIPSLLLCPLDTSHTMCSLHLRKRGDAPLLYGIVSNLFRILPPRRSIPPLPRVLNYSVIYIIMGSWILILQTMGYRIQYCCFVILIVPALATDSSFSWLLCTFATRPLMCGGFCFGFEYFFSYYRRL